MPLDDTGSIIVLRDDLKVLTDPLARIGITPIPDDQVQRYKNIYKAAWLKQGYGASRQGPFEWKTVYFTDWREQEACMRIRKDRKLPFDRAKKSVTLKAFLAAPTKFTPRTSDKTAAPAELVDLATHVERNVEGATFSVDYFDTDPVLNVHYGEQSACLGIWDGRETIAIADHPPIPSVVDAPPTGFLARLRRTLFLGGWLGQ